MWSSEGQLRLRTTKINSAVKHILQFSRNCAEAYRELSNIYSRTLNTIESLWYLSYSLFLSCLCSIEQVTNIYQNGASLAPNPRSCIWLEIGRHQHRSAPVTPNWKIRTLSEQSP